MSTPIVALREARISVQPLWGFSSSNPDHSQSRAEQVFKYYIKLGVEIILIILEVSVGYANIFTNSKICKIVFVLLVFGKILWEKDFHFQLAKRELYDTNLVVYFVER